MMRPSGSIYPPAVRAGLERRGLPVDGDIEDAVARLRVDIGLAHRGERTGRLCLTCFEVSVVGVDCDCPFCGAEF